MNEIAKKATADKFLRALEKEQLSKAEAGACIGFSAAHVSYLLNEKYWDRLGVYWDKILAWVNSGQSLREYSEKHGKVLPQEKPVKLKITTAGELDPKAFPEKKKIIDPLAEALWQQSVDNVAKEKQELEEKAFHEEIQKLKKELDKSPLVRVPNEEVQKIRIDIEINLIINGQKIKLA